MAMLMGLAHADTLDDFTNNLVSDLGPYVTSPPQDAAKR